MIPPRGRHGRRGKAKAGTAAGVARAYRATEAAALSRAPVEPEKPAGRTLSIADLLAGDLGSLPVRSVQQAREATRRVMRERTPEELAEQQAADDATSAGIEAALAKLPPKGGRR